MKVLVAMSGGVDSSVAAALLKKQGFSCIGVFMHFWSDESASSEERVASSNRCCSIEAQEQARRVAQRLDIPFYTLNYKEPFKKIVVDYYISEYQAGRTPNPCVVCNQFIKFGLLLDEAEKQGCDYLATGHYARIASEGKPQMARILPASESVRFSLLKSVDKNKDQTYFLYRLTSDKLKKILFPVGKYQKPKVRELAHKFGLPTATRKDSRGICFVAKTNETFLKKYLKVKPGKIVDINGVEIGRHAGLLYYTIGQRHGFGNVKYQNKDMPPLYVIKIDIKNNLLVLGEEKDLYQKELMVYDVSWISGKEPVQKKMGARIRYRHPINSCQLQKTAEGKYKVKFQKSQRAITPGQSVVFYLPRLVPSNSEGAKSRGDGEEVLGGGIILS